MEAKEPNDRMVPHGEWPVDVSQWPTFVHVNLGGDVIERDEWVFAFVLLVGFALWEGSAEGWTFILGAGLFALFSLVYFIVIVISRRDWMYTQADVRMPPKVKAESPESVPKSSSQVQLQQVPVSSNVGASPMEQPMEAAATEPQVAASVVIYDKEVMASKGGLFIAWLTVGLLLVAVALPDNLALSVGIAFDWAIVQTRCVFGMGIKASPGYIRTFFCVLLAVLLGASYWLYSSFALALWVVGSYQIAWHFTQRQFFGVSYVPGCGEQPSKHEAGGIIWCPLLHKRANYDWMYSLCAILFTGVFGLFAGEDQGAAIPMFGGAIGFVIIPMVMSCFCDFSDDTMFYVGRRKDAVTIEFSATPQGALEFALYTNYSLFVSALALPHNSPLGAALASECGLCVLVFLSRGVFFDRGRFLAACGLISIVVPVVMIASLEYGWHAVVICYGSTALTFAFYRFYSWAFAGTLRASSNVSNAELPRVQPSAEQHTTDASAV